MHLYIPSTWQNLAFIIETPIVNTMSSNHTWTHIEYISTWCLYAFDYDYGASDQADYRSNEIGTASGFPSYADRCGECEGEAEDPVCGSNGKTCQNSCQLENYAWRKYWDIQEISEVTQEDSNLWWPPPQKKIKSIKSKSITKNITEHKYIFSGSL